jgi:hypothetical protein
MPINNGRIEMTKTTDEGELLIFVYYDATVDPSLPQPLIDGPRGLCLDVTNTTGTQQRCSFTFRNPDGTVGNVLALAFGQGDPVLTGPSSGRSRTAVEMAAAGYRFRSDFGAVSMD